MIPLKVAHTTTSVNREFSKASTMNKSFLNVIKALKPTSARIALYLYSMHDPVAEIPSGVKLRKMFDVGAETLYVALNELLHIGIVRQIGLSTHRRLYVNPLYLWRGDYISKYRRIKWLDLNDTSIPEPLIDLSDEDLRAAKNIKRAVQ